MEADVRILEQRQPQDASTTCFLIRTRPSLGKATDVHELITQERSCFRQVYSREHQQVVAVINVPRLERNFEVLADCHLKGS